MDYSRAIKEQEAKLDRQTKAVQQTEQLLAGLRKLQQGDTNATQASGKGK